MGYPESFNELDRWRDELRRTHTGDAIIRAMEERIAGESEVTKLAILNRFLFQEHVAQRNLDAADAVGRRGPAYEIHRWRDEWRQTQADIDIVPALEERIRTESHPLRLAALRSLLAEEHRDRQDYAAAEAAYLADFDANPDEPRPLIFLASQKLHDENQPEAAMPVIDRAVEVALRAGIFRREALGVKARIAVQLEAYPVVEDVLEQIMRLTFTPGNLDVAAERDFFDRLPLASIDANVMRAYDTYCAAQGKLGTASPQRIDELILSFASARWTKVARIVGDVLKECEREKIDVREDAIGTRFRVLVEQGQLEAQGNLSKWRFSEVRLPDADRAGHPETTQHLGR